MPYKKYKTEVYEKTNGHCAYCGKQIAIKEMQIDHIIPKINFTFYIKNNLHIPNFLNHLTENDTHHIDNLNPSCRVCNKWKSAHHLELFRSELEEQVKRLNERSSNYRIAKKYGLIQENEIKVVFYFETIKK